MLAENTSGKYRILLVDDDPTFHKLLNYDFGHFCEIISANSAEKMFELLHSTSPFDLILLDLVLDNSRGIDWAMVSILRDQYDQTPVIIVTNDRETDTMDEAFKRKISRFYRKSNYDKGIWEGKITRFIQEVKGGIVNENPWRQLFTDAEIDELLYLLLRHYPRDRQIRDLNYAYDKLFDSYFRLEVSDAEYAKGRENLLTRIRIIMNNLRLL